jgi:hypothetical protein
MALTTHPYLGPRSKKEYSFTSTPFLGLPGLFYGDLYLYTFTPRERSLLRVQFEAGPRPRAGLDAFRARKYLTFSIAFIKIQLSNFETSMAHNFIKVTILQHTCFYMLRTRLTLYHGAHNCTIQMLTYMIITQ